MKIKRPRILGYMALGAIALYLFLATVPVVPYRPICGANHRNPIHFYGPLRPDYQAMLEKTLKEENFYYWKFGDQIFIRYVNIFDGNETFDRYDLHVNTEWRIVQSIAKGYTATEKRVTPPTAILDAIRLTEPKYGPYDPTVPNDVTGRFDDCEVKQAGAIWVEKLDNPANTVSN